MEPLLRRNPAERPATLTALSGCLDIPLPEIRTESSLKSHWRIVLRSVLVSGILVAVSWPLVTEFVKGHVDALTNARPQQVKTYAPQNGKDSVRKMSEESDEECPLFGHNIPVELGEDERMELIWRPPGEFKMGSPESESGRFDNEDLHCVKLTKGFWIAQYETTQGQWRQLFPNMTVVDLAREALLSPEPDDLGSGNAESAGRAGQHRWSISKRSKPESRCGDVNDALPVYYVSWEQATNFCARLTALQRKIDWLPEGYEFRLPTEAEWEYACRAGSKTGLPGDKEMLIDPERGNFCRELDAYAWFGGNSCKDFRGKGFDVTGWSGKMYSGRRAAARRGGTRQPNAWGICDMLGNVLEWCADWYGPYDPRQKSDPQGPDHGQYRVVRGGSWNTTASQTRAAYRDALPNGLGNLIGFRIVLGPKLK